MDVALNSHIYFALFCHKESGDGMKLTVLTGNQKDGVPLLICCVRMKLMILTFENCLEVSISVVSC